MYKSECWRCRSPFLLNEGYYFRYRWYCGANCAEIHTGVRVDAAYRPE